MIKIRAKSTLKLRTMADTNVDYEYQKNTPIDAIAKHVIHAVFINKGKAETLKFLQNLVERFDKL